MSNKTPRYMVRLIAPQPDRKGFAVLVPTDRVASHKWAMYRGIGFATSKTTLGLWIGLQRVNGNRPVLISHNRMMGIAWQMWEERAIR